MSDYTWEDFKRQEAAPDDRDDYIEQLRDRRDEIAETAANIIESGPSEQWTMAESAIVAEYRDLQKQLK